MDHDPRIIMVVIVLPSKVELRVLAQRDRLGPGVGGGDPAGLGRDFPQKRGMFSPKGIMQYLVVF